MISNQGRKSLIRTVSLKEHSGGKSTSQIGVYFVEYYFLWRNSTPNIYAYLSKQYTTCLPSRDNRGSTDNTHYE